MNSDALKPEALAPGMVLATIRSLLPSLLPAEQAVATALLDRADQVVELSSQHIAELAGASRATVVRTCQSLGFSGYQQLRVLLARDAAYAPAARPEPVGAGSAALIAASFSQVGQAIAAMTALLTPEDIDRAVSILATARRLLVVGNGLSAALAMDAAARLNAIGRWAEFAPDAISQQITARLFRPEDAVLVVSGSGAHSASFAVARAALEAGAQLVVITAFARSPLAAMATVSLVVGMPELSFRDEVTVTTRIPQTILVEGLISAVTAELGPAAQQAKALALEVIGENLAE
ncbi:MurR/RpiR family transcriptional regulator [Psychromicrobium xiongbiense]|uniref:MurR/RpiR family transcriptional regulator n=1 Tax=Psychromicrobium xiongbiense TaxID=3051184 RepID=UPI002552284B|nr:MurR/RpiR family transcriptional regulator [Psychromicrobium sp. YIM S02556]